MEKDALETYLNDHLAGATRGLDHARQLVERAEGTPFGAMMARIAGEIEEDRDTLIDLMKRLGAVSGLSAGDDEPGTFVALEAVSLGVAGKRSLWEALQEVAGTHPELRSTDFARLIGRAITQRSTLEAERLAAARRAFG